MTYTYTFGIWPEHGTAFSKDLYSVMKMMPLVSLEFTETEFELFRYNLKIDGFGLHEVSRIPYHQPETIIVT